MSVVLPLRRPRHVTGPFRHRPDLGRPLSCIEQAAQYVWRHKLAVYIAVIVTVSLVVQLIVLHRVGWR